MKKTCLYLTVILMTGIFSITIAAQKEPPPPPPPPKPAPNVDISKLHLPGIQMKDFYKQNPSVANFFWKRNNEAVIKLKMGDVENYDLNNEEQKERFVQKYGAIPAPPPPPPPPLGKKK